MSIRISWALFPLCVLTLLAGCGVRVEPLMPTPVLYAGEGEERIDPFAGLEDHERTTHVEVLYATARADLGTPAAPRYGNRLDDQIHLGSATVRIGEEGMVWEDLHEISLLPGRGESLRMDLIGAAQHASLPRDPEAALSPGLAAFAGEVNRVVSVVPDRTLCIYVHGAKVDFYNSCALTAELHHFTGRRSAWLAFAWPTHQNIFAYLFGEDVRRAERAGETLDDLLLFLARHTDVENIRIIGYSAGGRVLTRALVGLRERHPDLTAEQLHEQLKIDRAYFVAADVPLDAFLHAMPAMHDVARHIIFTVSDDDIALEKGDQFMGGAPRAGEERTLVDPEERAVISSLPRVHVLDVSYGKAERGFDITGHHYWHKHPWVSSEIIMAMLTDLRGEERGLEHAEMGQVWYLTPDYPSRVRRSGRGLFGEPAPKEPAAGSTSGR